MRDRVLAAWAASPARFRADANLEDDLALVGYRDRVVVELVQNAADAAAAAGGAGRLRLAVRDGVLHAANTGAPLTAEGVESIAVPRASAKRDSPGAAGRFGVGFAAVLSVSDRPILRSRTGAVAWLRRDAAALAAGVPSLRSELGRRGGRVPVLRLPVASTGGPVAGFDTEVVLPLRDDTASQAVRDQLDVLDPLLLIAFPALSEIQIDVDGSSPRTLTRADEPGRVVIRDGRTDMAWLVSRTMVRRDPALLTDAPTESRDRPPGEVVWALPVAADGRVTTLPPRVAAVVRAPTLTDDPMTLPAALIAPYPVDASRRRVTPGPLTDDVTAQAAHALAALLQQQPADPSMLALVPMGLPDGSLDATVHAAVLEALRGTAWLPIAGDDRHRQRPGDAVAAPDPLVRPLQDVLPSLLPAGWASPALTALGVSRPAVEELIDGLTEVRRPPQWWRVLYDALDAALPPGPPRDALGALPVPLVDGSLVTGPRRVVVPTSTTPAIDLAVVGIRLVHPDAAHPLLAALGAREATPSGLLDHPAVRAAVEASYDEDDPQPIADAVLALVAAAGPDLAERPWLADLALRADDGEWRPAGELVLPGTPLAGWLADDSALGALDAGMLDRWGSAPLRAAGVLDGLMVLADSDAVGPDHDLDDEPLWWTHLAAGAAVSEFTAVRDLEQLRSDAWPQVLAALASPPLRRAVVTPTLVVHPDGTRSSVTSYTAWWLSRRPVLDGRAPTDLCLATAPPDVRALWDAAPDVLDAEFLAAIGVVGELDDTFPDELLDRLADPGRDIGRDVLRRLNRWLAGTSPTPPATVRAVRDGDVVVCPATEAVVVDAPDLMPLLGNRAVVPVSLSRAHALAESLRLPLARELSDYPIASSGRETPAGYVHDELLVRDADGVPRRVPWRLVDGEVHLDAEQWAFGLGRAAAWRVGDWSSRYRRTEELRDREWGRLTDDETDLDEE